MRRVQEHISGPMLERFDVRLIVPPPNREGKRGSSSSDLRKAVARARKAPAMILDGRDMREVPGYEVAQKFSRKAGEIESVMPRASLRRKHRTLKLSLALAAVNCECKVGKEQIRRPNDHDYPPEWVQVTLTSGRIATAHPGRVHRIVRLSLHLVRLPGVF